MTQRLSPELGPRSRPYLTNDPRSQNTKEKKKKKATLFVNHGQL